MKKERKGKEKGSPPLFFSSSRGLEVRKKKLKHSQTPLSVLLFALDSFFVFPIVLLLGDRERGG